MSESGNTPKAKRQDAFLASFRKRATVAGACEDVGIARWTFYRWKKEEKAFADRFDEIDLAITEQLEANALDRALKGDTALTIFLLKARKPDVYREKLSHELKASFTLRDFYLMVGQGEGAASQRDIIEHDEHSGPEQLPN